MRTIAIATVMIFGCGVAAADDSEEATAKVYEYFDAFNARDVHKVAEQIYSTPVHIGSSAGHRVLADEQAAVDNLRTLYGQIDEQGWVRSVISNIDACVVTPGLVFADVTYSRIDEEGEPIPPNVRTNLYILHKNMDDWRIIAFYSHDPGVNVGCR